MSSLSQKNIHPMGGGVQHQLFSHVAAIVTLCPKPNQIALLHFIARFDVETCV